MRSDQKALLFLGAVGVLGAGVRVVRTAAGQQAPSTQPALDRQMRVADSAAAAQRKPKGKTPKRASGKAKRAKSDSTAAVHVPSGLLDRRGYIGKRLDLDVATAAQIDSLPGVSAMMARRIVDDRSRRGPFLSLSGLQRVQGAGRQFVEKIDTMVVFSGTYLFPTSADTSIRPRKRKR